LVGLVGAGFLVGYDWLGDLELDTSEVILKILQANFEMEITSTGNNVLTSGADGALNKWIGLGKSLQTFDQLGQVSWVSWLDGDLYDRGDRVRHRLEWVAVLRLVVADGTGLDQVLVDTGKTYDITAWYVIDGFEVSTHTNNGSLDVLANIQIFLSAVLVVSTHDSDLHTSADNTGEDTTEGKETTFVSIWYHLRDVENQWSCWVAVLDGLGVLVVKIWAGIQKVVSVGLGNLG